MSKRVGVALWLCVCVSGCDMAMSEIPGGDGDPDPGEGPGPGPGPGGNTTPLQLDGNYQCEAQWDLSGAIAADSFGDVVATLLISQAVAASPVPGFAEDKVEDALAALVHDPISEFVDDNTPAVLAPDSGLLAELDAIFSRVVVTSTIDLARVAGSTTAVTGREQIVSIELSYQGRTATLPVDGELSADLDGDVSGDSLVFAPHALELASDPLASLGLSGLLSIDDLTDYAASALDCTDVIADVAPGGLTVSAFGQSYTFSAALLVDACEEIRARALEQVIGLFSTELPIEREGPARLIDADADRRVERIEGDGTIGTITSLPEQLQAPFAIEFSATR